MTMPAAWDCHVHVFGDPRRYPLARDRRYTPMEAGIGRLRGHLDAVGATRVVLVQPTVYGDDHACLLDALDALGGAAVAVAAWHGAAPPRHPRLRGLRLDLRGGWSGDHARALAAAAEAGGAHRCHLELQVAPETLAPLATAIDGLGTPLVLDHLAGFPSGEEVAALDRLLAQPGVFVKLSALERAPGRAGANALAQHLVRRAPDRLLWGSDWPHTPQHPPFDPRERPLPFRRVDDAAALEALAAILGRPALNAARTAIPERLYGQAYPK
ncbi:MAG TPA: amidohydrolase family protein [Amaricoccus sp.]|nr:amidohydrolase family protein [Amaricoccus sp.]